MEATIGGEQK